ncbi:hypothetical protein [Pseudolysinimonas sp.]|uniref:hypothetical protein n=1 Tax=Pseudolysinimonas sp. TaxID=2680009 RepID=UPI003F7E9738
MSPEPAAWTAAWNAALDELERFADAPALGVVWEPPTHLGPLPAELLPRAQRVAAAQQRAIRRLTDERRIAAAHLEAVDAASPAPVRAIYVDLDA